MPAEHDREIDTLVCEAAGVPLQGKLCVLASVAMRIR